MDFVTFKSEENQHILKNAEKNAWYLNTNISTMVLWEKAKEKEEKSYLFAVFFCPSLNQAKMYKTAI